MLDGNIATLQYIILFCEVQLLHKTACSHFAYSKKEYFQVSQDKLRKHYNE